MNKIRPSALALLCSLLCVLCVETMFSQSEPRKFYKYEVVAATTANLEVYAAPSINDYGDVAFAGRKNPGGGSVFLSQIGQPNVDMMPGLSGNPNQFVSGRVQINDFQQIIQHTFISGTTPSQNVLRRIEGVDNSTLIAYANGAGSFDDFDQIYPGSISINNIGEPSFLTRSGGSSTILTTGIRPNFSTLTFPSAGDSLRPMISDCGFVVARAGANPSDPIRMYFKDLSDFEDIAGTNDGFISLGQSPAISNFCEVITFYGDLNQAGADAIGTNPGPGIFASIEIDKAKGTRKIVRLAGRLIEDNSASGGNDDGWCDPGETCMPGELGFTTGGTPIVFSSFDIFERVAVTHQDVGAAGIEDDIFVVSFLGTPNVASDNPNRPFSGQPGLWTVTTQIKNLGGLLVERPAVPVPVVQLSDTVDGRTVSNISVYDPLAGVRLKTSKAQSPGDHRLAFHIVTNNGNLIVRASRKVAVPVIFIPGVGGSILAECTDQNCSSFSERWPAGLNSANYPFLSLEASEKRNIVALGAVKRIQVAPLLGTTIYEEILTAMTTGAGGLTEYVVDNKPERRTFDGCDLTQSVKQPNLFIFAYDWRKSNFENAVKLRGYVRCIQRFYPETKVDIVAHSMGGLLARSYLLNFQTIHSVRKMVTIGSPFLGSPKSLKVLEDGSFFKSSVSSISAIRGFRLTSANRIFRTLVPHLIGAHELMPTEKYFELGGVPFSERFDFNGDGVVSNGGYSYSTTFNTFNSRFPTTSPYSNNALFHTGAQDDWRFDTSGVEYYQLFGQQIERETALEIIAKKRTRRPTTDGNVGTTFEVRNGKGDGTVPVLSAQRIGNGIDLNGNLIPEKISPLGVETDTSVEHNGLHKNARVQQRIFEILGITSQSVVGSLSHQGMEERMSDISLGEGPERESNYLTIEGVETLAIRDDLGRENTPINDDFELAIPDVNYESSYNEGTPNGWYLHNVGLTTLRQYTIKFRTGTDSIDIELVRGIGNSTPEYAVRYIDLQLPPNVECLLTVTASGMDDLRYDADGDGEFETIVPAHVRVTGKDAQDTTAPLVNVQYSQRTGQGRLITINAADDESGVGTVYYRIGETGSFQIYTGTFHLHVPFERVVEAFADDNVGNRSSPVRIVVPSWNEAP